MPGTQLVQVRQPVILDAGTRYQVSATCTAAGTLPDLGVFVRQINDFEDPKNDTFVRISSADDFTRLRFDRDAAIVAGDLLYRSAAFVQNYSGVTDANGAWQELSSRVNGLVVEYDTYITTFLTPLDGSVTTYPAADVGQKSALIAAYDASVAVVTAAEAARDAENIACEALQLELRTLQGQLRDAQRDETALIPIVSNLAGASGNIAAVSTSIGAHVTSLRTQITTSAATTTEQSNMTATVNNISTQLSTLSQVSSNLDANVYAPLTALLTTLQARVVSLQDDVTAAQLAANDCALVIAALQGEVDAARRTRDTALASVRSVCPDYVPS